MLPRFFNPHFLPQHTQTLSRKDLYADDVENLGSSSGVDPSAIEELNRLIKHSLPEIPYEAPIGGSGDGSIYQAVVSDSSIDVDEEEEEETVLFRLVSSSQPPLPLSLLPPPPPPSKTREPDAEDTEQQALRRKQRAEASAIEGADILRDSLILNASPCASKDAIPMQAAIPATEPCLMVVRTVQQSRKTRPPVPPSQLSHFPYVPDTSQMPVQPSSSKIPECPTIDAELIPSEAPLHAHRRRRRRNLLAEKERPPPQFWRPSPVLKGKCRGYAYGYPSNLSLADASYVNGGVSRPWKYNRDTMKKATYSSSSIGSQTSYGYGPNKR